MLGERHIGILESFFHLFSKSKIISRYKIKISDYLSDLLSKGETDQGRAVHSRSHLPLSHLLCQREGSY